MNQTSPDCLRKVNKGIAILKLFLQHGDQENLAPHIVRQVYKEFSSLKSEPVEGIQVSLNEDDVTEIYATLEGPRECYCIRSSRLPDLF